MNEQVSKKLIGCRVKAAREAKGWKQTQLAITLGLNDRQSISDIENGKRALKPNELIALTDNLGVDIEFFLDPFSVVGEAKFSWRASSELAEEDLDGFEVKANKWVGLLRWLREIKQASPNPLKHSLRLTLHSTFEDSIVCAEYLVDTLELGLIPADCMIEKVEQKLDIPLLFVDTIQDPDGQSISGATCHLQDLGVILINRNEPETRRFYNLAHELFHALTWDAMKPNHRESNSYEDRAQGKSKRIEQLANNFAAGLLMPRKSLKHFIDHQKINDVNHLLKVAEKLKVAPTALAWRLFNLKWINDEVFHALLNKRQQVSPKNLIKRFSHNFVSMLHQAIDSGNLSARKAANTMSMNLTELEDLFEEYSLAPPFEL